MLKVCPTCGREYDKLMNYCARCGIELVKEPNKCSEMRTELCKSAKFDDDALYCVYCGAPTTYAKPCLEEKELW